MANIKVRIVPNPLYGGLEFTVIGKRLGGEDQVPLPAPTMTVNGATSCSTPWTIHGASTTGMFHMTGENIIFTDAEDEGVWFTYTDDDGETVVKHATPDKVHQSTTPGAAPYVFDRDFVGGDGSPDHKYVGTLKIASRAGVPGSLLQVFEHECAWDVD